MNIFIIPESVLMALGKPPSFSCSLFPPPHSTIFPPWPQASIFLCSLEFYINGIIHPLYVWFLSLSIIIWIFIRVVAYMNGSFLLCWVVFHCVNMLQFIYSFTRWWTFGLISSLGLLQIKLLWIFVYKSLYEHMFALSCVNTSRGMMGWFDRCVFNFFRKPVKVLSKVGAPFKIPASSVWKFFHVLTNALQSQSFQF